MKDFTAQDLSLLSLIEGREAHVGVVGLGYVGLPIAVLAVEAGYQVTGLDIDCDKVDYLRNGNSSTDSVSGEQLHAFVEAGRLAFTSCYDRLSECDIVVVCVPTGLDGDRQPDLSNVTHAASALGKVVKDGALVILESTSFPGTTRTIFAPSVRASAKPRGLNTIHVAYSPERENPGCDSFDTRNTPRIVSGLDGFERHAAQAFYCTLVNTVVLVDTPEIAEAAKLLENTFRLVNISLINELKIIYDGMGLDVWKIIEAAATKPFGFMPFYPGPGVGGHCIPVDSHYLNWCASQYGHRSQFIDLAHEVNEKMTFFVLDKIKVALKRDKSALDGVMVLIVGVAYKPNVADKRESPAAMIAQEVRRLGGEVCFHDPYVDTLTDLEGRPIQRIHDLRQLSNDFVSVSVVVTNHTKFDYNVLADWGQPIIDTRNAIVLGNDSIDRLVVRA